MFITKYTILNRLSLLFLCFFISIISITSYAQGIAQVSDIRVGVFEEKTRFVLDMSQELNYRIFMLDNPTRIVIDVPTVQWQAGPLPSDRTKIIKDIRHGAFDSDTSRIVLDLNRPAIVATAYVLSPDYGRPYRLVIDLKAASYPSFRQALNNVFGTKYTPTQSAKSSNNNTPPASLEGKDPIIVYEQNKAIDKSTPLYKPLIVIDAGHGGRDPGAIAKNGVYEKYITLNAAKELKEELERTGQFRAVLTRTDDTYIALRDRTRIARNFNGDIFISLHADSLGRKNVRGASIYTLSDQASDRETKRLSRSENLSDALSDVDLSREEGDVADILIDIAMRDSMNQSKVLADTLKRVMSQKGITLLRNTHRNAGFAVLKAPDMPSVLLEMGYLSNPYEAKRLSTESYRRKIARAVVAGIREYFKDGVHRTVY